MSMGSPNSKFQLHFKFILNYEYDKSLRAIGLNPNWKKESGFSMSLSLAFWYFLYSLQMTHTINITNISAIMPIVVYPMTLR